MLIISVGEEEKAREKVTNYYFSAWQLSPICSCGAEFLPFQNVPTHILLQFILISPLLVSEECILSLSDIFRREKYINILHR